VLSSFYFCSALKHISFFANSDDKDENDAAAAAADDDVCSRRRVRRGTECWLAIRWHTRKYWRQTPTAGWHCLLTVLLSTLSLSATRRCLSRTSSKWERLTVSASVATVCRLRSTLNLVCPHLCLLFVSCGTLCFMPLTGCNLRAVGWLLTLCLGYYVRLTIWLLQVLPGQNQPRSSARGSFDIWVVAQLVDWSRGQGFNSQLGATALISHLYVSSLSNIIWYWPKGGDASWLER